MADRSPQRVKMDIYGLQARLMWANERMVEEEYRDMDKTESSEETVAWYIEEGEVSVSYARGSVKATEGEWLLLRAEQGRQHFSGGARLMSLRFHLRLRGGLPLFARRSDVVVTGRRAEALAVVARRLIEAYEAVGAPGIIYIARERLSLVDNFRIEAAFMDWLGGYVDVMESAGEVAEALDERDSRVAKALVLIEDHRMRDKFSEADLARGCGLSVNQLGRLFRRDLGVSPFQYYETRRLELARHALAESSLPIKEVGFELGFSSPPHFSNWFTEHEGFSPRAWRVARQARGLSKPQTRASSA